MNKNSDKIALEDAHLNILMDSFFYTQLRDIKNPLVADKKKLIFKIVDKLKVQELTAKKYLNILESRNLIIIDGNAVYYNQNYFNKRKKEQTIEIDKFFKELK